MFAKIPKCCSIFPLIYPREEELLNFAKKAQGMYHNEKLNQKRLDDQSWEGLRNRAPIVPQFYVHAGGGMWTFSTIKNSPVEVCGGDWR